MAVNRFYQGTPYQASLYTPPVEFVAKALEAAQKQYDVNFAAAEELRNKYIESRVQDRVQANEIQANYQKQIDDIVGKYNGDYSQATKDLYSFKKQIERDFKPGGQAHAIQQSYLNQEASLKAAREGKVKGIYDSDQVRLLEYYYKNLAPVSKDATTNT